jgi:biopolymer transport protein ExbB
VSTTFANLVEPAAALSDGWDRLWAQAWRIWVDGGWAMIPIAIDAAVLFGLGVSVWLRLRAKGNRAVPEKIWRLWIEHPAHREGPIGDLLHVVTDAKTLEQSAALFAGVRAAEIAPFERDLKLMKVCIAIGPLLGLLGTVTGMLATFTALSTGSGGDQTMAAIARGISEALITTETGLVVALPGLFFHYQLAREKERYAAFLAHLETVCTQMLYRRLRREHAA